MVSSDVQMPTPEVSELVARDKGHVLHPGTSPRQLDELGPVLYTKADGVRVRTADGRWLIDAYAGMGNCLIGYGRHEMVETAAHQMDELAFVPTFFRGSNSPSIELATKLVSLAPEGMQRVFFSSGGGDANETAFKIARVFFHLRAQPSKTKVLFKKYAYHGVTLGTLSANGIPAYREGYGPLLPGFEEVASSYCYRCDLGMTYPGCGLACADDLEAAILREGPETVAAFIAEPIAGVGGHLMSPPGYLRRVREICDRYEVLFIADEVVTGFGRTGAWFGVNHEGVTPDIMTFAKGLSSGYLPLGATIVSRAISDVLVNAPDTFVFTHGYTYSGHPTCCAVGLKNVEIIEAEGLVEKSRIDGEYLSERLGRLRDLPIVGEIRSLGLLASIDLTADRETHAKFPAAAQVGRRIGELLFERGVVTRVGNDIIQLRPPLIIGRADLDEVVDAVEVAISSVCSSM